METVSYGEFSQTFHARTMQQHLPLSGTIEVTRRCPLTCVHCYNNLPMSDHEASEHRAHLPGALPNPRRAGRCRVSLAVVHRRRDLRATGLPRHLHLREEEGFPDHPLHERHADHAENCRLSRRVASLRDRDHLVWPHQGNVRAADGRSGIVRQVPARHRPAPRTKAAAGAQVGGRHRERARAARHADVRRRARRRCSSSTG